MQGSLLLRTAQCDVRPALDHPLGNPPFSFCACRVAKQRQATRSATVDVYGTTLDQPPRLFACTFADCPDDSIEFVRPDRADCPLPCIGRRLLLAFTALQR